MATRKVRHLRLVPPLPPEEPTTVAEAAKSHGVDRWSLAFATVGALAEKHGLATEGFDLSGMPAEITELAHQLAWETPLEGA